MADEHKQERKRDMQCNTSGAEPGPGTRRSLVPPMAVLAISGPLCQHRTASAICLLVVDLRDKKYDKNGTDSASEPSV